MVPSAVLLNHLAALLAVWAVVVVAGVPTSALLRVRLGFPGHVLLGLVYWSVALYALPFDGGLVLAGVIAAVGFVAVLVRNRPRLSRPHPQRLWAAAILTLGCGAYGTLLLRNYVPLGVDAGMVGALSRTIAFHWGLPTNFAPWLPDLYFPAVNLGLSTVGGVAMGLGCEPGSAVLGVAVLAYAVWILGTYPALRLFARPTTAAVLAVAQAWDARWAQNTIGWGGFPTVAGLGLGIFAARLMWDAGRRCNVRSAVALGLSVGALPLVHGICAAVWVYTVAPVLGVVLLVRSPRPRLTAATLFGGAAVSVAVLACYLLVGQVHMSPSEVDWSRGHLLADAPTTGTLPVVVRACLDYMKRYAGHDMMWLGVASAVVLLLLGKRRQVAAVSACVALLVVVLANAHWWVLPFSMMLYPDRAVYWAAPFAAVVIAMAVTTFRRRFPRLLPGSLMVAMGVVLLGLCSAQNVNQYQKSLWNPPVGRDGWEALQWANANLRAPGTFVEAKYGSVGSLLPVCADLPTNAWQVNHCAMEEAKEVIAKQRPTHRMHVRGADPDPVPTSRVVFQNETVTIVQLRKPRNPDPVTAGR